MLWQWSTGDEEAWKHHSEGVNALFSAWVDHATEAAEENTHLFSDLSLEFQSTDWFRSHLEAYRETFCGSPNTASVRDSARQVGFAHIYAQVPPSVYVGLYNLMFSCYHTLEADPEMPSLPPLITVRRRWLSDTQTTLDTYTAALTGLMASLSSLASIDPLTGTLNRRGLWERITQDIISRSDPGAFVVWDLDNFKAINDTFGHPRGDMVLQQLAVLEQKQARIDDALGRLGGDEFVWWVPGLLDLTVIRRRIQNFAETLFTQEHMTFSAGVAWYPTDGQTADQLYIAADAALYRAKHAGRRCWSVAGTDAIYPLLPA